MIAAYVGLGGNLGGPADIATRLRAAAEAVAAWDDVDHVALSGMVVSAPLGPVKAQPAFVNAVARVEVADQVAAWPFLQRLLAVEAALGRARAGLDKGPRTIDVDLLLYGDAVVSDPPRCVVPHPGLVRRAFALIPLREVAGGALLIPGAGVTVDAALADPAVAAQEVRAMVRST